MIQIINIERLASLIKPGMTGDEMIDAMQEVISSIGKEISHIEKYVGDIDLTEEEGGGGAAIWGSISGTLADQTDLNSALSGKANVSHSHTGYALTTHNHDTSYSAISHNHSGVYAEASHNHDGSYSALGHDHSGIYSPVGHDHDSDYADIAHTHAGVYEAAISKSTGYATWTGAAWSFVNETYSLSSHNHSGVYSEVGHNHSGVYATVIHNLVDTTNHPVSGLTAGHFLKASAANSYGFAAHGLTYTDVGAAASGHNHSGVYEPVISAGSSGQYWAYNKSWATLNQAAVSGLTTSDTPQFAGIGLNTAAESGVRLKASGQYYSAKHAQSYGATMTIDFANGNVQYVALTGNITSLTLSNPKDGARYIIILKQDATGSRTVSWPASVKWPSGTAPTLSGANKYDVIALLYDGTNSIYYGQASLNHG